MRHRQLTSPEPATPLPASSVEAGGVTRRVRAALDCALLALPLDGRGGWLLVAAAAIEAEFASSRLHVPDWRGVLFWPLWLVLAGLLLVSLRLAMPWLRPAEPRLRAIDAAVALALLTMVLTDVTIMATQALRDLGIYLKAGDHFLTGAPVYLEHAVRSKPLDLTNYPFLYPPLTLPFFAALARLPLPIAAAVWLAGSTLLALVALRAIGLSFRWSALLLLWPPLLQGLFVGNVAAPAFALFALAPWLGAGLVLGAIFKAYTGIAALWLVRERRWDDLAIGLAALLALVAATLPFTGPRLWASWLAGLSIYQASQPSLPTLYGFGLPRYLPYALFVVLAAAALFGALRASGREGLARLGTATVIASPSLFGHGFLVALPAMLTLRSPWLWLVLTITSTVDGPIWYLAIGLIAASWAIPRLRTAWLPGAAREPLHPLGREAEPWPEAPEGLEAPAPAFTRAASRAALRTVGERSESAHLGRVGGPERSAD